MDRRKFLAASGAALATALTRDIGASELSGRSMDAKNITIRFDRTTSSLPHYWETCFGSDRTAIGLRDQWRQDLIRVRRDAGMQSVRCHGLFDDEMGIASSGDGTFNYLYVDQIYDFLLEHNVRPFVELGFMPEAMASSANRIFAYKGNTSPPRRWQDWREMVTAFTKHCVQRYGISEVSTWKFEVWNEPNIAFWSGTQEEYFELFRQSVMAIKDVDKMLQVGGPSTAQLDWVPDLIRYCVTKGAPIDFSSTHVYPGDPQRHIFGADHLYAFEQVIPAGLKHVKEQIASSPLPDLPLWITEWSSQNPAFIADTVANCKGLCDVLAYWTFSNVFDEKGVPRGIFNDAFGLLDQWGIARPSLHVFNFLHRLGVQQLNTSEGPLLATRKADGSLAILLWNLIPAASQRHVVNGNPMEAGKGKFSWEGDTQRFRLKLDGWTGGDTIRISQVNSRSGTAIPAWEAMGRPQYPSSHQLEELRAAAELPTPETRSLRRGDRSEVEIIVPPNGVALLEVGHSSPMQIHPV
jgi:xylan 1,4-beta-xylosidase